jgi:hypothetical protein
MTDVSPGWPALMGVEMAAAYLDMGANSFRALARAHGVRQADLGQTALARWKRSDLDAMLAGLAAKGETPAETLARVATADLVFGAHRVSPLTAEEQAQACLDQFDAAKPPARRRKA